MLLTITTDHQPTTDLGFLMHKHPNRLQSIELSIGKVHIFYPEFSEQRSSISLLLDIDPIEMVKGSHRYLNQGFSLHQYVNDRPYVASSFMSVAISKAFSSALNGNCNKKPELVKQQMAFSASISVLPSSGGETLIKRFFEPLGYEVDAKSHALDEKFPKWGDSKYYTTTLKTTTTLKALLSHLYVLIPALDNNKHYFVSEDEVEKLLKKGDGWLSDHPEKNQIVNRYLNHLKSLTKKASLKLDDLSEDNNKDQESIKKETLHQKRLKLVLDQIKLSDAQSVIDLGCGEGKLLRMLIKEKKFTRISGVDVSYNALIRAKKRLYWDEMSPMQRNRIQLFQSALTYKDSRFEGYDAAAIVEVIEHLDENRLTAFERVVFEFAKPKVVVLTTPNSEYNVLFENMSGLRHRDHRFEWTRHQFEEWANAVAERNNYSVKFLPVGEEKENVGPPTQMGVFTYGN